MYTPKMETKKFYLLTVVDWGEWSAHGIVDSLEAAEAWKARGGIGTTTRFLI